MLELCRFADIPDGGARGFAVEGPGFVQRIIVARRGGAVYGYVNSCPHAGTMLDWRPDQFLSLDRTMILCATHGALFEIASGVCIAGPCTGDRLTPVAIELGREHLREAGLVHRCEFVPGDFFEAVPGGADTYLLKSVLHDWDDRRAAMILAACGRAIPPDGRLLVVERIVPDRLGTGPEDQALACGDLHMLVQLGGRERTRPELTALLEQAGFDLARVTSLRGTLSLLVARPASA